MKFAVVIEQAENNYSAYVPDLPGCVTVGDTLDEVKRMIQEAVDFHVEGMLLHGETVPDSTSRCCYVEVDMERIGKRLRRKSRTASS